MTLDARATVLAFVEAFGRGDLDALGRLLADDFVGHVTTADGDTRAADRAAYLASVEAMDVGSAGLRLHVPDIVEVEAGRVLVLVEVHAARRGRTLHNFSGQLVGVRAGRVVDLWMTDALPRESDEFWSA